MADGKDEQDEASEINWKRLKEYTDARNYYVTTLDNVAQYGKELGLNPKTDSLEKFRETIEKEGPQTPGYYSDKDFWRYALLLVGAPVLIAFLGALVLAYSGKAIPEILITGTSTLIGVLAGLFVSNIQKK